MNTWFSTSFQHIELAPIKIIPPHHLLSLNLLDSLAFARPSCQDAELVLSQQRELRSGFVSILVNLRH